MNVAKTKYMLIRSVRKELKESTILKCSGVEIERIEKTKYLGIIIDSKLRFEDHCEYMLKKIGKKVSFLNRIGNDVSVYTRYIQFISLL